MSTDRRRCKHPQCNTPFKPRFPGQEFCSPGCCTSYRNWERLQLETNKPDKRKTSALAPLVRLKKTCKSCEYGQLHPEAADGVLCKAGKYRECKPWAGLYLWKLKENQ
jgi:hypothetical protein